MGGITMEIFPLFTNLKLKLHSSHIISNISGRENIGSLNIF